VSHDGLVQPILFLDVDGVFIPYGATEAVPDSALVALAGPEPDDELLARIDAGHGPRLAALGCELVWATGWEDEANDEISPRLGLPSLPVVAWTLGEMWRPGGVHWKTHDILHWASGRPFVWVDDEIGPADRESVEALHPAPALLLRVDPHVGLTKTEIEVIGNWLADRVDDGEERSWT
jgi:hypothetical protein